MTARSRCASTEAGIPHFWRVEDEDGTISIHVYELGTATTAYAPVAIARETLRLDRPFPIELDVQGLYPDH